MPVVNADPLTSSTLRVREVDPHSDLRWEAFVAGHPQGCVYHHPAWLKTLALEYGRTPVNLACEDGAGNLRGILPLLSTRGLPFRKGRHLYGSRLSSLPRTPVAGPLATDRHALTALLQAAIDIADRDDRMLQVKLASPELDGLVDGLVGVPWRFDYVLHLPERPEQLRFGDSRNHAAIKRNIKSALSNGVTVRAAETESDLIAWYKLYLENMRWHAVPVRSLRFFQLLWELMRPLGLMRLLIAEQERRGRRKMLAGSVYLSFGSTAFYAFNGASREDFPLRPNDVIHWQAINDACNNSCRYFDFGEVPLENEGLARFKKKWGTTPTRLYRYYYPAPHLGAVADSAGSTLHRLTTTGWRYVPLNVTSVLCSWIYSYL